KGIDSRLLLKHVMTLLDEQGYRLGNCDITICAEQPKLNPHITAMQQQLAECMACDPGLVSIKATTTEQLGYTGRGEGIAAYAVALIETKT
ncbi:MAG: 2-C-methyl-D-erythritol 2,4-cyclodiphosphate synthase, partial [Muribaculaceae bacterium]|nr:2-C-methyl-D-erythritol 2,4-cyclodiphosphate synthase [Muribaculaceae bacterium]